jgi:nicotinate phosphoribosyltransferase
VTLGHNRAVRALLTDMYQLTMLDAYVREGLHEEAVFELSVRRLPPGRRFLVAAGLEQALQYLEQLHVDDEALLWLRGHDGFAPQTIDYLRGMRFSGDVDAMPEGTVFFPGEPVLRVTASLPQAQFVESRLLNLVHLQTLVASKAARVVLAAQGRVLVDFGMRRAHGEEAAVLAARASYLCGFDGTATVEAGLRFGLPVFGTMAHSYIEAHDSEVAAFEAFVRCRPMPPRGPTLLIDTYDTEAAAHKVVALSKRLAGEGLRIGAVRIDSGDLAEHARRVRRILDEGGCQHVTVFASGNLDEHRVQALLQAGAPIDGFGVGTALTTSGDAPSLDAVYKLQSHAGRPRRKRSEGKVHWPGAKQVWRLLDEGSGLMLGDRLGTAQETGPGMPLLEPVMRGGRRVGAAPSLQAIRSRVAQQLGRLPPSLRGLEPADEAYPLEVTDALQALAAQADAATRA